MKRLIALVLCLCLTLSLVSCNSIQNLLDRVVGTVAVEGTWNLETVDLTDDVAEEMYKAAIQKPDEGEDVENLIEAFGMEFDYTAFMNKIIPAFSIVFKDNGNFTMTADTKVCSDAAWSVAEAAFDAMAKMSPEEYVKNFANGAFTVEQLKQAIAEMGTTWEAFIADEVKESKKIVKEDDSFKPESLAKQMGGKLNADGNITLESGSYRVFGNKVTLITVNEDGETETSVMTLTKGDNFFTVLSLEGEDGKEVGENLQLYKKFADHIRLVKAADGEPA